MQQVLPVHGMGHLMLIAGQKLHNHALLNTIPASIHTPTCCSTEPVRAHVQLKNADEVEFWHKPEKEGWLQSQGEVIKTWRKRWFVLKDGFLFRFLDHKVSASSKPRGIIDLSKACPCRAPLPCLHAGRQLRTNAAIVIMLQAPLSCATLRCRLCMRKCIAGKCICTLPVFRALESARPAGGRDHGWPGGHKSAQQHQGGPREGLRGVPCGERD